MQVKKQQLELDMEQWIGSEWGKEYDKAVYCNLVYLTSMQSAAAFAAKSLQSCLTLCDPIDGSPPGSPIPGILQARTLEWVAISTSLGKFIPRYLILFDVVVSGIVSLISLSEYSL